MVLLLRWDVARPPTIAGVGAGLPAGRGSRVPCSRHARPDPRVVIVMPAYNAAPHAQADLRRHPAGPRRPHDPRGRLRGTRPSRSRSGWPRGHRPPPEPGLRRQPEDLLDRALERGADVVVMLHPDYQYDATRIPALVAPILAGERDLVLGSRFLGDPARGRHAEVEVRLEPLPDRRGERRLRARTCPSTTRASAPTAGACWRRSRTGLNSDDFVFDQELIAQVVAAGGMTIGEIGVPTRYFEEASSVSFRRSVVYGLSTMRVVGRYLLHRSAPQRSLYLSLLAAPPSGTCPRRSFRLFWPKLQL